MHVRFLPLVILTLVLMGCGSSSAEPVAPSATPQAAEAVRPVATTLPAASEPLVEFEAAWLCQVQRFAFTDLSEIDAQREQALDTAGFTSADYAGFELRLEEDGDLRSEVKDRFVAQCTASELATEDVDS